MNNKFLKVCYDKENLHTEVTVTEILEEQVNERNT